MDWRNSPTSPDGKADIANIVSEAHISKDVDHAMDEAIPQHGYAPPGVSIRNGPILDDKMDVEESTTNGFAKRKARNSTGKVVKYNDDESEEQDEDIPLVCYQSMYKRMSDEKEVTLKATHC